MTSKIVVLCYRLIFKAAKPSLRKRSKISYPSKMVQLKAHTSLFTTKIKLVPKSIGQTIQLLAFNLSIPTLPMLSPSTSRKRRSLTMTQKTRNQVMILMLSILSLFSFWRWLMVVLTLSQNWLMNSMSSIQNVARTLLRGNWRTTSLRTKEMRIHAKDTTPMTSSSSK